MHETTFRYLAPTPEQVGTMSEARDAAAVYAQSVADLVPEGPDKTYIMRQLRTVAMWVNVAITRLPDGTPRA